MRQEKSPPLYCTLEEEERRRRERAQEEETGLSRCTQRGQEEETGRSPSLRVPLSSSSTPSSLSFLLLNTFVSLFPPSPPFAGDDSVPTSLIYLKQASAVFSDDFWINFI